MRLRDSVDDFIVVAGRFDPFILRGGTMAEERQHGMGGGSVAADELRLLIERAERLEEEKKGIADDIKDVMAEAKSRGYDTKAIRKILQIRKKKKEEYQEEETILETYMTALGMI
ncbi:conserved hypothetical protein [Sphingomonas sp. EC-HK361]|nr:conserved hypothetical protein [Sphingomonas sp. EC-HK361]